MTQITLEHALGVQTEQLIVWQSKLSPDCYNALETFILASNKDVVNPDFIKRGVHMSEFIQNYKPIPGNAIVPVSDSFTMPFKGEFKFRSPINREYSAMPNVVPLIEDTESVMDIDISADGTGFVEWDIEELDECEGIGLWFKGNELTDYDGVFELPLQLVQYLESLGYNMDYCA